MRQVAISLMLATLLFPVVTLAGKVRVEVLQNQLAHPWALAFLPDDRGNTDNPAFRRTEALAAGGRSFARDNRRPTGLGQRPGRIA